ncbi:MAG: hypothetical protein JW829_18850 [Pirellulales bacterium]|nr:hypothetical protein [Pirellulales bacterium]
MRHFQRASQYVFVLLKTGTVVSGSLFLLSCLLISSMVAADEGYPPFDSIDADSTGNSNTCPDWGAWQGWGWMGEGCQSTNWLDCLRRSLWPPPLFRSSETHGRGMGRGEPLEGTSWLNRPYHLGWFAGSMWGDNMHKHQVDQHNTFFGGYQLGWDFDHYWGTQIRLGMASPELQNLTQTQYHRSGRITLLDADLLYYPWGDSRIRPYVLCGIGSGRFDFRDELGSRQIDTAVILPFGIGIKHHYRRWLSLRLEVLDNLAFASTDIPTMHNLSLAAGVEIHFGGHPRSYWPWNPSRHIW